jgi:tetratricopeptide (TPR) repeat protein
MSAKISMVVSVAVVLVVGIFYANSANAQGAPASLLADQLKTQYVFAKIGMDSNGTNERQRQVPGGQSSSTGLTNDDIIKLVQAKLPDSIVIAKIKSSTCDFDTTADGLIKLKQAGISDSVLQAMVEAPPPSEPTVGTEPGTNPGTNPAACNDYGACISSGYAALASSQWDDAIATFQKASTFDASKPDAWAGTGNAYLGASRKDEAAEKWDKALAVGGPLTFAACHGRSFSACEMGNLVLGPKQVSFASADGQQLFAVPPSQIASIKIHDVRIISHHFVHFAFKADGKNYVFQFVPVGVTCETKLSMICPDQGIVQQRAVSNYVSQAIPKLASGALGSSVPGQR